MSAPLFVFNVGLGTLMDIIDYEKDVKAIAYTFAKSIQFRIDVDDLAQEGWIGLLDAQSKYDPKRGASFRTYAYIRIKGAIADYIRANIFGTRGIGYKAKEVEKCRERLERQSFQPVPLSKVAKELDLDIDEVHKRVTLRYYSLIQLDHVEDTFYEEETEFNPLWLDFEKFLTSVKADKRSREIFVRYYISGQTLAEIAELYGVSEGRVSQLKLHLEDQLRSHFGVRT